MKSVYCRAAVYLLFAALFGCRVQNNPPELIELTPAQAFVGEQAVLTGYQFGDEPVVLFGESTSAVTATITSKDDNTIRATVPLMPPGPTQVRVRNREGTSDPLPFDVKQPAPSVATVSPANGLPGTSVVIQGNYLNQLLNVRFDEADAIIKDSTAQQLTVEVPPNAQRGPQVLVIDTRGGQIIFPFIVAGTPRITSVSPRAVRAGGELVIQGTNLTDGLVAINGLGIFRDQTTVKDTEIRAIVPVNATSGSVTVTVFEKLVATSPDTVQIVRQPLVANIGARDGVAGEKLLINGVNLRDITRVTFNGTAASYRIISDSQIEATVPALTAPANVTITLSSAGGAATVSEPFFYFTVPSGISFSPTRQLPNQPITITGQNLYRITEVRINGTPAQVYEATEGSVAKVFVPITATSGPITVVNRAGRVTTTQPLVVVQKPVVTDLIPKTARPGERVVLRGDYLLNAQIIFTGTTTPAADGGKNEDTERWVLVPTDAQNGPIRVTNITNEPVLTEPFTVSRVVANVDFSPKTAKAGEEIVITGANLATVQEVRFNNGAAAATAKFTLSGNTLRVTVPANATTGQICLVNLAGTICTSANFTVAK